MCTVFTYGMKWLLHTSLLFNNYINRIIVPIPFFTQNMDLCIEIVVISRDPTLVTLVFCVKNFWKCYNDFGASTFFPYCLETNTKYSSASVWVSRYSQREGQIYRNIILKILLFWKIIRHFKFWISEVNVGISDPKTP